MFEVKNHRIAESPNSDSLHSCGGFGLIEVVVAILILMCGFMGVMALFQWSDVGVWEALRADRALAAAESRIEAKRTRPWRELLMDDLDGDGKAEVVMRDDGLSPDEQGGDGIFTASAELEGVHLVWTVQPDWKDPAAPLSLARVGSAALTITASYRSNTGQPRQIHIGTIRANPNYVGLR